MNTVLSPFIVKDLLGSGTVQGPLVEISRYGNKYSCLSISHIPWGDWFQECLQIPISDKNRYYTWSYQKAEKR